MGHVHHGMDSDLGVIRRLLDFLGFALVAYRLALDSLETHFPHQLESLRVAQLFRQHADLEGLSDVIGPRGRRRRRSPRPVTQRSPRRRASGNRSL